jgi:3',5'-cyclic AMP phosphodiesterase CpdA
MVDSPRFYAETLLMTLSRPISRRDAIAASLLAAGGTLVRPLSAVATASAGALRIAHLTDMHVQPELRADEGFAAALRSLDHHDPAFIITGGDHVMDASAQPRERAKLQFDLYDRVLSANTKLKTYPVIGNHDVWGWGLENPPRNDVEFGKAMAIDRLKLKSPFYSFDAGGWHLIILDSIHVNAPDDPDERIYYGQLGPEQTEWLKADLASTGTKTPIAIFSHIPIVAVCVFFTGHRRNEAGNAWRLQDYVMHADARQLVEMIEPCNVKLLVSGHIHMIDRAEYLGSTFICDGAVSGNWWRGPRMQFFPEGYGLFDLHPDGRFEHQYVTYGWDAVADEHG